MTQEFVTLPREVVEQALTAWTRGCPPDCKDGMTDSGGVHPWGEAALIQCPSCRAVEALRAALDQPQDHVPDAVSMVPDGWKLVPVEPTQEMLDAYIHMQGRFSSARSDWAAMLASAPQPPTTDQSLAVQPQGEQEPYAWHYTNNGGASVWHMGPSNLLDADMDAAKAYPKVHRVTPLYTHPQLKREPLTNQEIIDIKHDLEEECAFGTTHIYLCDFELITRAIEAAHNIK